MTDYRAYARTAAAKRGIDPDIFERQIMQESGFRPDAVSPAGARGIAQFMPGTAEWVARRIDVSLDDFWAEPRLQLDGALWLMGWLLGRYGGNYCQALAGYNAGHGAVDRYGGVPPYRETERYVATILGADWPNRCHPGRPPAGYRVDGTDGAGLNLRERPDAAPVVKLLPEGALVEARDRAWRPLRDPTDGATGWGAEQFVVPA